MLARFQASIRVLTTACLATCCGVLLPVVSAQTPNINSFSADKAVPKPGEGHDYIHLLAETVDPASGGLSIDIKFPTPSGRGLAPAYELRYNSSSASHLTTAPYGSLNFQQTTGLNQNNGWTDNTPLLRWSQSFWQPPDEKTTPDFWAEFPGSNGAYYQAWAVCAIAGNFTFSGLDGATHSLYLGTAQTATGNGQFQNTTNATCAMGSGGPPMAGDGEVSAAILDNQTLKTNMQNLWGPQSVSNWTFASSGNIVPITVTDASGVRYTFPGGGTVNSDYVYESYASSIEDKNGNEFSWSSDTLNRSILSGQGSPVAGSGAYTIGGLPYTFSVTNGPPSSFNVPIAGGEVVPSGDSTGTISCPAATGNWKTVSTSSGLETIKLPNSTQLKYYWGAYTDGSGGLSNPYGLVSQIIYPTGGWVRYTWTLPSSVPSYGANLGQWQQASYEAEGLDGQGNPAIFANGCKYWYSMPVLAKREVSYDGSRIAQTQTFQYTTTWPNNANSWGAITDWTSKTTTVTTTDNVTNTTTTAVYTYLPASISPQPDDTGRSNAQIPVETREQLYDGSGTTNLVRTIAKSWYSADHLASETTTLENGATSTTTYCYSQPAYSNPAGTCSLTDAQMINQSAPSGTSSTSSAVPLLLEKHEFDYGVNPLSGAAPTRKTVYTFQFFPDPNTNRITMQGGSTMAGPMLLSPQVSTEKIYDSTGALIAETDYGYDESALVTPPSTVIQHDNAYSSTMKTRGNLTSVKKCIAISSGSCSAFATTTMTYDIAGQLQTVTDPLNNPPTQYFYTDSFSATGGQSDAYVTSIIWPDNLTTGYTYRLSDGQLSSATDENGNPTTYGYDNMGRPNLVQGPHDPDNNNLQPTTRIYYDDSPGATSIETTELMSDNGSSQKIKSTTKILDGVGHVIQVQSTDPDDPSGIVEVDSQYDGMGRLTSVTNPYRPGKTSSTDGSTIFTYDALGRMTSKQTQSDKATEWWCYLGIQTRSQPNCRGLASSISGSWVDYQDQNGNDWQRVSDGLGRLVSVVEPDGNSKTPVSTMETDYTYSGLDDLIKVVQAGASASPVVRQFQYDPASRLTMALNPESGRVLYSYDLDGNLYTKTDARGIVTTYKYDNRNRLLSKSYSKEDVSGTPITCYQYSGAGVTNGNGRLANEWTQSSSTGSCLATLTSGKYLTATSITAYNPSGQVKSEQQCTIATCSSTGYPLNYAYDLGGELTSYNDGNGINFTQSYSSGGQLKAVWSSRADYPQCLYSAQMTADSGSPCTQTWTAYPHVPSGALQNAYFGSAMTLNQTVDPRLRIIGATYTGTVAGTGASGHSTVPITGQEQTQ